jgi:hypothetical protein
MTFLHLNIQGGWLLRRIRPANCPASNKAHAQRTRFRGTNNGV